MAKPLTPAMRNRLIAAYDHAGDLLREGFTPKAIIQSLVTNHIATFGYQTCTQRLRCAGIEVCNTGGDANLMLNAWMVKAAARLDAHRADHTANVAAGTHSIITREAIHAPA